MATTSNRFHWRWLHDLLIAACTAGLLLGATRLAGAQTPGTWTLTSPMPLGTQDATATTLADGRTLVAGGGSGYYATDAVQLYDPAANRWTVARSLRTPRKGHASTQLADGRVLVTGGFNVPTFPNVAVYATAELYNPGTGRWGAARPMAGSREGHTATLLADGRVLVTGGIPAIYPRMPYWTPITNTAEVYNPRTNRWASAGAMAHARVGHAAALLPDGRVLVVGGYERGGGAAQTAELYDPATNTWSSAATLNAARPVVRATLLVNGLVLVIGNDASAEVYDPTADAWTPTGSLPWTPGAAALLASGGIAVAAGGDTSGTGAAVYDPATGTWLATGSLSTTHTGGSASRLLDGRLLVAGGAAGYTVAELFTL